MKSGGECKLCFSLEKQIAVTELGSSHLPLRRSFSASSCFYLGKSVEQLKSFHFRANSIFARSFFSAAA
jgi:hypothetical protein